MPVATNQQTSLKTLLAGLVAIPSFSDHPEACRDAIDYVKAQLQGLPLYATEFSYEGHPALILSTRKTKRPKVLFLAHADIIACPPEMLTLQEHEGRFLGRGVFDMKGCIAAYIKLFQGLGADLAKHNLALAITTDEEPARDDTAGEIIRRGWRAGVVVNPDAVPDWNIERVAKGYIRYRVDSSGVSGHGSRPWLYRNAIKQLVMYLSALEPHFQVMEPCGDPQHHHATYSVNVISGGQAYNQIPGHAQAEIEIRIMPPVTTAQMDALVRGVAAIHAGITLTQLSAAEPTSIDPDNPYVKLFGRTIENVTARQPKFITSHGGSDSSFFIGAGMPVIMSGPPAGGHHSLSEWVDAEGLEQFHRVLHEFTLAVSKL